MLRRTRCPHCKGKLEQGQRIHPGCIEGYAEKEAAKARRKAEREARARAKVDRAEIRARRRALETIPELIKAAQREFNAYIRLRDQLAGHPCISSGRPLDWAANAVDAGHYRSVGSASHLRFDERNCHAQSKHDNRYGAGRAVDYRIGLIGRIGLEAVESLEADNTIRKWTREELRSIRDLYRQKRRDLEKQEKA